MNKINSLYNIIFNKQYNVKIEEKAHIGQMVGWVSIVINFLLFLTKLIFGLLINSIALIADAIHSVTDIITSIILVIGYKIMDKPPDKEHPFGHHRAEYISSLIMSIIIILAGIEFIKISFSRLAKPEIIQVGFSVYLFIFLTIIIKGLLGYYSKKIGKKINSQAVAADAIHHLTDALGSIFVLFAVAGSNLGFQFMDGAGGIIVGIILIWAGYSIARDSVDSILGTPPSRETIKQIRNLCKDEDRVIDVHDIIIHHYGLIHFISLHIEVNKSMNIVIAHDVADKIEKKLKQELGAHCTIHIDPVDTNNEFVDKIKKFLNELIQTIFSWNGFYYN